MLDLYKADCLETSSSLPDASFNASITNPTGQIWQGDCTRLLPQIPDNHVALVLTDIPYNNVNRPNNGLHRFDKGNADVLTFDLEPFLDDIYRVCRGSFYIFCEIGQVSLIRDYFLNKSLSTRLCTWEKTNPSPMNGKHLWLSSTESCVFAKKPRATFSQSCHSCVWRYPSTRNKHHPTEKPLALFKYLIESSSLPGDIVLDPCMGSGTTCVAAAETGRQYLGIELDPQFFTLAQQRLSDSAGRKVG